MIPQAPPRKRRNSSKVNLFISFIFHATILLVLSYFAAREGFLGKQIQKISVEMVKEKTPPKPKSPEKPKTEPPKVEQAKPEVAKVQPPAAATTPKVNDTPKSIAPPSEASPAVAPPPAELPSFVFDGGKTVETSTDAVQIYKGLIEYAFRSKWKRPANMDDAKYMAEVQVSVAPNGRISSPVWKEGSGNKIWDDSIRQAIEAVTSMNRPPPTNFPPQIVLRFDVQQETETILQ